MRVGLKEHVAELEKECDSPRSIPRSDSEVDSGHTYIGHNYMGHNYIGHHYAGVQQGHNYIGHNYIGHD